MRDCKIILPVGCNAKCSFCFSKGTDYAEDYIAQVNKSLNKLNESVKANITGGEPTIYPKLIPLLIMLKGHKNVKEIILTTNGSNLLEKRSISDYINHLNISVHHYKKIVNDNLFGVSFDVDYSTLTNYFNRHGVDVRCNCYLSEYFSSVDDLMEMVDWASKQGFNSIKFRNDFSSGMEMNKWEKMFRSIFIPMYEDSCPVCRVSEYLYRIPVLFGYGVPEPSDYEGTFEYVINQDGNLYWDYSCKKPVKEDTLQYMSKTFIGRVRGCGDTLWNRYRYEDGSEVSEIVSGCGL